MADDTTGETKPVPKQEGSIINLIVQDQAGAQVHFKVKTHTRLEKVIAAYCQKKAIEPSSVRFVFDGTRVNPASTPEDLGMDDGDSIDVFQEQVGGQGR
jgi:small ubiquitin-related modifier